MEITQPQNKNRFGNRIKSSITARMLMVGFLILILLIPLSYVESLIRERQIRQSEVIDEINSKWGNDILVYGPILKLPYKHYITTTKYNTKTKTYTEEVKTELKYVYIFPETLTNNTNANSKTLKRGNFESAVFTAQMNFSGEFIAPQLEDKGIESKDIVWEKATIIIKTSNLKGIKNEVSISIGKNSYAFETNFNDSDRYLDELESNFIKESDLPKISSKTFNFDMIFNASQLIRLIPVGKTTTMKMSSNWPDPSFTGNFLPSNETKEISNEGFKADWKVLHINRPFSQQYIDEIPNLQTYAFGTKFVIMVDEYQKSERSAKYGFLVIGLTFLIFFLIQTMSKIPIHPFQYLMIGLALVMFYTLLVSISEHSNFLKAYLFAGISVVTLISVYSKSILKHAKFPMFIALSLTALYSFIYVIIQLENYALLVGSIGLFIILAIVMFVSRKIDWQSG